MIATGTGSNKLAVILDSTTRACEDAGEVLGVFGHGFRYLGKVEWNKTLRIALRRYGSKPMTTAEARAERPAIDALLKARGIRAAILMQSPRTPGQPQRHRAFNAFAYPGSPYKWAGTTWQSDGIYWCPVLHPHNYEWVYGWLIRRWYQQALALAQGRCAPMPWPEESITPNERQLELLRQIAAHPGPVSFDIETSMDKRIISALGFSAGGCAVSIPWDTYRIAGTTQYEPGILDYGPIGAQIREIALSILASPVAKVGHNSTFDVYELRRRGIEVSGELEDTLLAAHSAFNQFRKGLQQAAALEFCVEPWKSIHKAAQVPEGEDGWLANPEELRGYNLKDAYVTEQLFHALMKRLA